MKYVIFADVDGTIYDSTSKVSWDTKDDIQWAQYEGAEFVLNTGNGPFEKMKWLAKELKARYIIASNGATILDTHTNELIYKNPISKEDANPILKLAMDYQISADFWDEDMVYFNKFAKEKNFDIVDRAMGGRHTMEDFAKGDIYKFEFYVTEDQIELLDKLQRAIPTDKFNVARMWDTHMEVTAINSSKGQAITDFCKMFNVDPKKTMAIGDSANDHSMFEVVGYSYAMGNADETTKSKAQLTTHDVAENGLGKAIKDYIIRVQGDE